MIKTVRATRSYIYEQDEKITFGKTRLLSLLIITIEAFYLVHQFVHVFSEGYRSALN